MQPHKKAFGSQTISSLPARALHKLSLPCPQSSLPMRVLLPSSQSFLRCANPAIIPDPLLFASQWLLRPMSPLVVLYTISVGLTSLHQLWAPLVRL